MTGKLCDPAWRTISCSGETVVDHLQCTVTFYFSTSPIFVSTVWLHEHAQWSDPGKRLGSDGEQRGIRGDPNGRGIEPSVWQARNYVHTGPSTRRSNTRQVTACCILKPVVLNSFSNPTGSSWSMQHITIARGPVVAQQPPELGTGTTCCKCAVCQAKY